LDLKACREKYSGLFLLLKPFLWYNDEMGQNLNFDILSFGSLTVDVFLHPEEMKVVDDCMAFCIGEKIETPQVHKFCGGGAANTSIGFSKLALKSAAFGVIGSDAEGIFIRQELKKHQVDDQFIIQEEDESSGFSVIVMCEDGRRTVFHHKNSNPDLGKALENTPCSKAIYIGHLAQEAGDLLSQVPAWKEKCGGLVAWNPGKNQFKQGFESFQKIFPSIDVLILNKEEAALFTGKDVSEAAAQKFLEAGVKKVVITDGKRGADMWTGDQHFVATPEDIPPVSTLGAGDAFSIGVVGAVLYDQDEQIQMNWGQKNAERVIQHFGAQNGQLDYESISSK